MPASMNHEGVTKHIHSPPTPSFRFVGVAAASVDTLFEVDPILLWLDGGRPSLASKRQRVSEGRPERARHERQPASHDLSGWRELVDGSIGRFFTGSIGSQFLEIYECAAALRVLWSSIVFPVQTSKIEERTSSLLKGCKKERKQRRKGKTFPQLKNKFLSVILFFFSLSFLNIYIFLKRYV